MHHCRAWICPKRLKPFTKWMLLKDGHIVTNIEWTTTNYLVEYVQKKQRNT